MKNYSVNNIIKKVRRQTHRMEKIIASCISDKGLVSKIHKELLQLNGHRGSFWSDDSVLKFDCGDGCGTLNILNCIL